MQKVDPDGPTPARRGLPAFPVVCGNCGYVRLHSVGILEKQLHPEVAWQCLPLIVTTRYAPNYSESTYSLMEFMREFPDDAACLDCLWRNRYAPDGHHAECPKCERERKFHKVAERPAWSCDSCGHHLHPLAGTIFHKSSTSLHLWFYAIHLMTSTRCGVSAKQLERELGVTYKTAWRMFNLIRNKLMAPDDGKLSGDVEIDEASVDGKPRKHPAPTSASTGAARSTGNPRPRNSANVVEQPCSPPSSAADASRQPSSSRRGPAPPRPGRRVDQARRPSSTPTSGPPTTSFGGTSPRIVESGTPPASTSTGRAHKHHRGLLRPPQAAIRGTYRKVSHKWLQGYLNEFTCRYNERHSTQAMFRTLLQRAASPS